MVENTTYFQFWDLVPWLCSQNKMGLLIWNIPKRKVTIKTERGITIFESQNKFRSITNFHNLTYLPIIWFKFFVHTQNLSSVNLRIICAKSWMIGFHSFVKTQFVHVKLVRLPIFFPNNKNLKQKRNCYIWFTSKFHFIDGLTYFSQSSRKELATDIESLKKKIAGTSE